MVTLWGYLYVTPFSWEEIKEIMVRINLYEDLLYFDKDHIDDKKYRFLMNALSDEDLQPENLKNVNQSIFLLIFLLRI